MLIPTDLDQAKMRHALRLQQLINQQQAVMRHRQEVAADIEHAVDVGCLLSLSRS